MTQSSFPKTVRMKWNDGASDTSLYVMYGKQGAGDGAMEGWNFRHISMCSGMEMDKLGVSLTETLRMEGGWMKLINGASVTISSLVEGRLIREGTRLKKRLYWRHCPSHSVSFGGTF